MKSGTKIHGAVEIIGRSREKAKIVKMVIVLAHELYHASLCAGPQCITDLRNDLTKVAIGDIVLEISSAAHRQDPDGIGLLTEIRDDPVWTKEQWAEQGGALDEKIPTRRRYVLALVFDDGRRFVWENASFVKVRQKEIPAWLLKPVT